MVNPPQGKDGNQSIVKSNKQADLRRYSYVVCRIQSDSLRDDLRDATLTIVYVCVFQRVTLYVLHRGSSLATRVSWVATRVLLPRGGPRFELPPSSITRPHSQPCFYYSTVRDCFCPVYKGESVHSSYGRCLSGRFYQSVSPSSSTLFRSLEFTFGKLFQTLGLSQ